jgi:hypothetical protein
LNHTDSKEPYFSPPIPLRLAPEDWTGEMRDLTLWFLDRQLACDLPTEPFYLWPHARIAEPEKWYGSIDTDIEAGPKGPRAGSLLGELRRLREIVEETHRPA